MYPFTRIHDIELQVPIIKLKDGLDRPTKKMEATLRKEYEIPPNKEFRWIKKFEPMPNMPQLPPSCELEPAALLHLFFKYTGTSFKYTPVSDLEGNFYKPYYTKYSFETLFNE